MEKEKKERKWEDLSNQGWDAVWPSEDLPYPKDQIILDNGIWASEAYYGIGGYSLLVETANLDEALRQYVKAKEAADTQSTEWIAVCTWESGISREGVRVNSLQTRTRMSIECTAEEHDWWSLLEKKSTTPNYQQYLIGSFADSILGTDHGGVVSIEVCANCGNYREKWILGRRSKVPLKALLQYTENS